MIGKRSWTIRVARLVVVLILATSMGLLAACGGDDDTGGGDTSGNSKAKSGAEGNDMAIAVVIPADAGDPFFTPMQKAAEQAAEDFGITVDYQSTQKFDVTEEKRLLEAAIATKPDGLVVFVPDPDALGPTVQKATDQGIPTIFITSGQEAVDKLGALLYLGEDAILMGREAGELMAAKGVKKAICVNHSQGTITLDQRCEGFAEGLGDAPSKVIVTDGADPTATRNRIAAALQSDPDIDGVFTLGPPGAEPALDAIESAGRSGKVKLVTTDLSERILQAVSDGDMLAALDQQQWLQVYEAISLLRQFNLYGVIPTSDIITAPNPITKDKADEVIELTEQGIR